MCTVTYLPTNEGFFITSNRDEKIARTTALTPASYSHGEATLVYPKDAAAGGSWIAVSENGNTAVLLNGAFEKHMPTPPYRKSRGVIFLEILENTWPYVYSSKIDLTRIEPFTIILFCSDNLYECRWDGKSRHAKELNKCMPQIWSSTTLYDHSVVNKREQWFREWLMKNPKPSPYKILQFHQFTGDGDLQNDLFMNRNNLLRTLSITSIEWKKNRAVVVYKDLIKSEQTETLVSFSSIQKLHEV